MDLLTASRVIIIDSKGNLGAALKSVYYYDKKARLIQESSFTEKKACFG